MDFHLDDDQTAILLSRHAGAARVRALGGDAPAYDHDLEHQLDQAGFLDVVTPGAGDRLNAALVQEAISLHLGCVSTSARLLVAPSLPLGLEGPVAVVRADHRGPARFLADACSVVLVANDGVRLATPARGDVSRPVSRLGWPVGMAADVAAGVALPEVDPREITTWSRIALAIELVGAMRFATDLTVGYVIDREQFGRSIGSFQALQHRAVDHYIRIALSRSALDRA
ncbi:MAG TPA: acyl-CoA dehydrogenase family protein, partial [Ilumatobacteraceae bacterium]|nr:acyl-CoA dehydrogenase family protein [Ilumatobacteraceae bacterium]